MTKRNSKLMVVLSLLLVGVLAVGGTLAYLSQSLDAVKNHFTINATGGDAEIIEDFDPKDDATPGAEVKKIVTVKNKSVTEKDTSRADQWVALKITFVRSDTGATLSSTEMGQLNKLISLDIQTANWERKTGTGDLASTEVFYYKGTHAGAPVAGLLPKGTETTPLFNAVKFKTSATTEDYRAVYGTFKSDGTIDVKGWGYEGFDIVLSGAVVQYSDPDITTLAAAKVILDGLMA